ncbi:hypothetical protein EDB84DRAFT_1569635 [Lactarius hengduanensis]|nr:hypothetical protein EDB84DRAFT_1569635 [Lactarius hengduanensis]
MWHELLRSFIGVKELRICNSLSEELSRALQVDGIGLDLGLLPGLRELVSEFKGVDAASLFGSFIHARQVASRPIRSSFPSLPPSPPSPYPSPRILPIDITTHLSQMPTAPIVTIIPTSHTAPIVMVFPPFGAAL